MSGNPPTGLELLPCPFCGGGASLERNPHVNGGLICDMVVCDNDCVATFFHETEAKAIAAWNTRALSPQTLPAPGEVEAVVASASIALMYLQTGFIECPQCGEEVPTKDLDATHELATVVQPAPSGAL